MSVLKIEKRLLKVMVSRCEDVLESPLLNIICGTDRLTGKIIQLTNTSVFSTNAFLFSNGIVTLFIQNMPSTLKEESMEK
jgi:hypothetical protein